MKKAARRESTQSFTEITDIVENVVIFTGGHACQIIEITATNFSLQSAPEQMAKIAAYASLLNSLSFPIQILIRSKSVNIGSYLDSLNEEAQKAANKTFSDHITRYRQFVSELIRQNSVLDKKFYIVISFSYLEGGAVGATTSLTRTKPEEFAAQAKIALRPKSESIMSELSRIGLKGKILGANELINLYHDIYNDGNANSEKTTQGGRRPIFSK